MTLGDQQLRVLIQLSALNMCLVAPDPVSTSLVKRGLCRERDGSICIAADGLRALADAMDAGRVDDALKRLDAEIKARRAKRDALA